MPIYEYACQSCGKKSTMLILKKDQEADLNCRHCGSGQLKRLLSGFALHRTEADRLNELDPSKTPDESFYRDDRNIGLRAKKRMKELGVDLGDSLNEKIDKARTSKIDDLIKSVDSLRAKLLKSQMELKAGRKLTDEEADWMLKNMEAVNQSMPTTEGYLWDN